MQIYMHLKAEGIFKLYIWPPPM